MSRKIHMQDQVFNNVKQIMNHKPKMPIQMNIAGINIILQRPGDAKANRYSSSEPFITH